MWWSELYDVPDGSLPHPDVAVLEEAEGLLGFAAADSTDRDVRILPVG
ncbi:MAG: hypothetical protein M3313_16725 [Actinomycetota bacterium]|nr:hypothetical protein [Actinomycetota bacterium]